MPYIKQERRKTFDDAINTIVEKLGHVNGPVAAIAPMPHDPDAAKGDLNYVIYSIVKKYIEYHGLRYHRINDFIGGTLTCCQDELYRRIAGPYEDEAIKKNGDIE
jgi:hypothetical protein